MASGGRQFLAQDVVPDIRLPLEDDSEPAADASVTAVRKPETNQAATVSADATTDAEAAPVHLNVNAREFCPSVSAIQPASVLSAHAAPFEPSTQYAASSNYAGDACELEPSSNPEEDDIEVALRMQHVLNELARAPARLDTLMPKFIEDVFWLINQTHTLRNLADIIVDFAISSPNVSYTCACVCGHFCSVEFPEPVEPFRHCLLRKCKHATKMLRDTRSAERKHLTMFIAELFLGSGDEVMGRSLPLARAVKRLLLALLKEPEDDDVKTVIQVLKLCGWELANEEVAGRPSTPPVPEVVESVVKCRSAVGPFCQKLIDSIVQLQCSNWGRSYTASDSSTVEAYDTAPLSDQLYQAEPVFFNSDGKQITRTEAGYDDEDDEEQMGDATAAPVPEQAGQLGGGGDTWPEDDSYDDDPDLNAEIRAAYEQFCEQTSGWQL